ncbi:unnamed protein product [Spirodela intermedia]|uniref:chitinase n=1 Tax=Spirodela intermedia TaxID=51605 RepID=A0A7I8JMJ6_SPIIN|nr:unnamed protein product [Spirodela intermedia]CAA6671364.1 unnamed protein product [Spirodela intermedia]
MGKFAVLLTLCLGAMSSIGAEAQQCGRQAGGALCAGGLCCSQFGWCGNTAAYCDRAQGCQSQCWGGLTPATGISSIVSQALCCLPARNFYTYSAFITAANSFPAFGTTGDLATRKREIAAFFGQTSHETTGARKPGSLLHPKLTVACAPGKKYYGRGPIQITHNYNYGPAGQAIGAGLLKNPDLVASDAVISFKTALWFWMTPQSRSRPRLRRDHQHHQRGLECGRGPDGRVADRIGFYNRYCNILGVSPGANLDCYKQRPFT